MVAMPAFTTFRIFCGATFRPAFAIVVAAADSTDAGSSFRDVGVFERKLMAFLAMGLRATLAFSSVKVGLQRDGF